jgi:hypothetical protein
MLERGHEFTERRSRIVPTTPITLSMSHFVCHGPVKSAQFG